ncbi:hypothetical protein HZA75_05615 [Candidatus Roizmanbacteria bacterium]|nr:hypothetical protein [Candidatus Roizmanbacteria bacterium]
MDAQKLSTVISKGLKYLTVLQEKDGSFLSFSSINEQDFSKPILYSTTFLNSWLLLETKSFAENKKIFLLRKNLASLLFAQKGDHWSWNYWIRNSAEAETMPYPDDLDDTFCALAALYTYDPRLITGDAFAYLIKVLTTVEKKEGGPYMTWLVKKSSSRLGKDVDFAVKCNIAYFLYLQDIELPKLNKFFANQLKNKKILSLYYSDFYAPLYFLSRFYLKGQREISEIILQARNKNYFWENPLKTALALLTLFNLKIAIDHLGESITYLLQFQKNGRWQAFGFCLDPSKNGQKYFSGSPALTTLFCLKVLQQYKLLSAKSINKNKKKTKEKYYSEEIKNKVLQIFAKQDKSFHAKSKKLVEEIYDKDVGNQIPLMSYYFTQAIKVKKQKLEKELIITLGVGNVLGWIAYTIYDDFFDGEGNPRILPLANLTLRQLVYIFDTFPKKTKPVRELFHSLLNKIDAANAWEIKTCRIKNKIYKIPKYNNLEMLANKSIGHALGPLVILLLLDYKRESKEFKTVYSFFKYFLIAKQLNDDGHDWENDLKKGQITPVVALILKKVEEKKLTVNAKMLKELFWQEIIVEVCDLIYKYVKKARKALYNNDIIVKPEILENFLEIHKQAADAAMDEHRKITAFLKTYK